LALLQFKQVKLHCVRNTKLLSLLYIR